MYGSASGEVQKRRKKMPRPGFEPGLLRPQRNVLTTRRSRLTGSLLEIFRFKRGISIATIATTFRG